MNRWKDVVGLKSLKNSTNYSDEHENIPTVSGEESETTVGDRGMKNISPHLLWIIL